MARKGLDELKVGVFVSVGLALVMIMVFMIGSESRMFQRQYRLFTNFKNISGLRVGAPVQLAGLRVGYVDDIKLPDDAARQEITVVLRIHKKYQNRIRSDSIATIETQGLLGDKFVYVSIGSEVQAVIPDHGILPSKETASIFSLAEKAGTVMDNIGEASEAINEMLSSVKGKKGEGDIKAILTSVKKSVEQVEKGKGLVHALIYDPKGEDIVSNLSNTMKSLSVIIADADKESKGKMGGLIENLRNASADLRKILDAVSRVEGTLGKFVMDPSLYDNLNAFFGRANRNRLLRAVVRSTMKENDRRLLK